MAGSSPRNEAPSTSPFPVMSTPPSRTRVAQDSPETIGDDGKPSSPLRSASSLFVSAQDDAMQKMGSPALPQYSNLVVKRSEGAPSPTSPLEASPLIGHSTSSSLASAFASTPPNPFGSQPSVVPHRPQDLENIFDGHREATPKEKQLLDQRRRQLETQLQEDRIKHERDLEESITLGTGPSLESLEEQGKAVSVAPGVFIIDPAQVKKITYGEDDGVLDSESPTPVFVPPLGEKRRNTTSLNSPEGSPRMDPNSLNEDEDVPHTPVQTPAEGMNDSITKTTSEASITTSKDGTFAKNTVQSNPFTKTLKYYGGYQGKENSPSKARRNASLPEELVEMAKDAMIGEGSHEDLDQYRDYDLAPLDPVFENNVAGDLVTLTSPIKASDKTEPMQAKNTVSTWDSGEQTLKEKIKPKAYLYDTDGVDYSVQIPGYFRGEQVIYDSSLRTNASHQDIAAYIRHRATIYGASDEDAEEYAQKFLAAPETFIIDKDAITSDTSFASTDVDTDAVQHTEGHQHTESPDHNEGPQDTEDLQPAFINIIGMLPEAMFWAAAKPIALYTNKAFTTVMEKLAGLIIEDEAKEEET